MSHSLVAKLNRTDTTLDLSQKAEKGMRIGYKSGGLHATSTVLQAVMLRVQVTACHVGY